MDISYQEMKSLQQQHDLSVQTVSVYAEIVTTFVQGSPVVKRTISSIAEQTGFSRATVRESLKELLQCGLLEDRDGYFVPVSLDVAPPAPAWNTGGYYHPYDTFKYSPDMVFYHSIVSGSITVPMTNDTFMSPNQANFTPCIVKNQPVYLTTSPNSTYNSTLSTTLKELTNRYSINDTYYNKYSLTTITTTHNKDITYCSLNLEKEDNRIQSIQPSMVKLGKSTTEHEDKESLVTSFVGSSPVATPPLPPHWPGYFLYKPTEELWNTFIALGPEHWAARKAYRKCLLAFDAYLRGERDDDPLESFSAGPYTSVGQLLAAEQVKVEMPPDFIGNFAGRGQELLGRWKARQNKALTWDTFLETMLMGDWVKPEESDPQYHAWRDMFMIRKKAL